MGFDFQYSSYKNYITGDNSYQKDINNEDCGITLEICNKLKANYKRIFLISKSSGLKHISNIILSSKLMDKISTIIFTPGYEWENYIEQTHKSEIEQLIFVGTKDRLFNVSNLKKLENSAKTRIIRIEEADHSLEVDNLDKDLGNLKKIMNIVREQIENRNK